MEERGLHVSSHMLATRGQDTQEKLEVSRHL